MCKSCQRGWKSDNRQKCLLYAKASRAKAITPEVTKGRSDKKRKRLLLKVTSVLLKESTRRARRGKKHCGGCSQWLIKSMYGIDRDNSTGLARRCRVCRSSAYIRKRGKKRGMIETFSPSDCWIVYKLFSFKCFKCNSVNNLSIDHHKTDSVLSSCNAVILCKSCNSTKSLKNPSIFYSTAELDTLSSIGIKHS
ncbi:MAG: hypothetical protein IMF01_09630 [Proteobacteria bacterium]|nr:hypothetical protein [Pseudomonadota bacterium]